MNSNERTILEAMLAVREANEHETKSLLVHTESSAEGFINTIKVFSNVKWLYCLYGFCAN